MPLRPYYREQVWLLPPSLGELIPSDHPARFVAAFIDGLDSVRWLEMGIAEAGDELGAPAYHPRALLSVWLYGFMTGIRSARKLETACRDQLPYLWLTGWQQPDHNTLWRFYKANREGMRRLFKRTVRTAVRVGLVDLAVQAVDGSKIAGNASRDRSHDEKGLVKLLERTEVAIRELEAQNESGAGPKLCRLPAELVHAQALREQVEKALQEIKTEDSPSRINLTDRDARILKSRHGVIAGYNAQAMVSPLQEEVAGGGGLFITALGITNQPDDHGQLVPMIEAAREMTGTEVALTLADGGYHSGATLAQCEEQQIKVLMPEAQKEELKDPYHKEHFPYDPQTDSYTCPQGQKLDFRRKGQCRDRPDKRIYQAKAANCRACPAFGQCTKDRHHGRKLEVSVYEDQLKRQRALMATEEAKSIYGRRKELPEPVFGILKESLGARRFLLRGLANVLSEWLLLGTAFNLRSLWRVWQSWSPDRRWLLTRIA